LLLIGIVSFIRMIERDIRLTTHARRMRRIRHYFVKVEPRIQPYLPYSIYDDKPTYLHTGLERVGLRSIVSSINNTVGAALIYLIVPTVLGTETKVAIAAVTFVALFVLHELYATSRERLAESKAERRFPSPAEQGQ